MLPPTVRYRDSYWPTPLKSVLRIQLQVHLLCIPFEYLHILRDRL